jgi:hypothetical protein
MSAICTKSRTVLDASRLSENRAATINLFVSAFTEARNESRTPSSFRARITPVGSLVDMQGNSSGVLAGIAGLEVSGHGQLTGVDWIPSVSTVENAQFAARIVQDMVMCGGGWSNAATADPVCVSCSPMVINNALWGITQMQVGYFPEDSRERAGVDDDELLDWEFSIAGLKPNEIRFAKARFVAMGPYQPDFVEDPYD